MCPPQVRDLEERLVEKEHELKQVRRNLDESEGAIAQVRHSPISLFLSLSLCLYPSLSLSLPMP